MRNILVILFIFVLISAVPSEINYQGKLTDTEGVGINDTVSITYRLYSSESGTEILYSDTIPDVSVEKGLFNITLSDFPDTLDFRNPYWIELEINDEVVSPRNKLSTVPYAISSQNTQNAIQTITTPGHSSRVGNLILETTSGSTLSDYGDSIRIIIGGESGGSSTTWEPANFRKSVLNHSFTFNYVSCNTYNFADSVLVYTVPSDKNLLLYGVNLFTQKPTGSGSLSLTDAYICVTADDLLAIDEWAVGVSVNKDVFFPIPMILTGGTRIYNKINGTFFGSGTCGQNRSNTVKSSVLIWGYLEP